MERSAKALTRSGTGPVAQANYCGATVRCSYTEHLGTADYTQTEYMRTCSI